MIRRHLGMMSEALSSEDGCGCLIALFVLFIVLCVIVTLLWHYLVVE